MALEKSLLDHETIRTLVKTNYGIDSTTFRNQQHRKK